MASRTVLKAPAKAPFLFPDITAWCAHVTVTPLDNNKTVFKRGSSKGLIGSIPIGGQLAPSSTVGDKALVVCLFQPPASLF